MMSRVLPIMRKEFIQVRRDRRSLAIILVMPLMQLFLFGYALNTDVKHMPTIIYDQAQDSSIGRHNTLPDRIPCSRLAAQQEPEYGHRDQPKGQGGADGPERHAAQRQGQLQRHTLLDERIADTGHQQRNDTESSGGGQGADQGHGAEDRDQNRA